MIRGIDHLVIACADPDAAAAELEGLVGIACTAGGRHPGAGTANRLAFLADGSYIELIGVDDPDLAREHPIGAAALRALEAGGGLATYALLDDDLAESARTRPSVGAPTHGSRDRPDGERVEWWTAVPGELGPDRPPFVIEHAYTGAEWGAAAMRERATFVHPIGSAVELARLDIAVDDPMAAATALEETLGLAIRIAPDLAVATIGPHVVRLRPRRGIAVPAVVTLRAEVEAPRTVDLLGLRFDVERADGYIR